jgi:hypothetical protein
MTCAAHHWPTNRIGRDGSEEGSYIAGSVLPVYVTRCSWTDMRTRTLDN